MPLVFMMVSFLPMAWSNEPATMLTCTSKYKTASDYSDEKWQNENSTETGEKLILRDKVFTGLDTQKPKIRSITQEPDKANGYKNELRQEIYTAAAEEFDAQVVSRDENTVFLIWKNDPNTNKVWTAAIDTANRTAVVAQIYDSLLAGVGVEYETLECK